MQYFTVCTSCLSVRAKIEEVKKLKIGDPLDRSVAHGPQNHRCVVRLLLYRDCITVSCITPPSQGSS